MALTLVAGCGEPSTQDGMDDIQQSINNANQELNDAGFCDDHSDWEACQ